MKLFLLAITTFLLTLSTNAQTCVPDNYDWGNATFGVSPDPNQGESFEVGIVGTPYYDVIYVKCPSTAGDVLGPTSPFASAPLDSVRLNSITLTTNSGNIPLTDVGLELTCNNNGEAANPCMFYPGGSYCGDISGTPTVAGTWPVTINITAYVSFLGSQAIDYPLTGYTFTITGEVNVDEQPSANYIMELEQNIPNPADNSTVLNFTLANHDEVSITITNLIGEKVKSKMVKGKKGLNSVTLNTADIPNGIYLYSIQSENKKLTKRMVIQH